MTKELKVSKIQQWLNDRQEMLDRGIVATPTEEYLESFADANNGSMDILLMQMSINFGYLSLIHI